MEIRKKGKVICKAGNWEDLREQWYDLMLDGKIPGYELHGTENNKQSLIDSIKAIYSEIEDLHQDDEITEEDMKQRKITLWDLCAIQDISWEKDLGYPEIKVD